MTGEPIEGGFNCVIIYALSPFDFFFIPLLASEEYGLGSEGVLLCAFRCFLYVSSLFFFSLCLFLKLIVFFSPHLDRWTWLGALNYHLFLCYLAHTVHLIQPYSH
ncbi:MAG: hypothetical protein J3R72DRAFT_113218 [Linnemannia gamsii]|nr:MAG: hypothetical protein J3R72DRAFT_113218 [Linnemannia gamsii]